MRSLGNIRAVCAKSDEQGAYTNVDRDRRSSRAATVAPPHQLHLHRRPAAEARGKGTLILSANTRGELKDGTGLGKTMDLGRDLWYSEKLLLVGVMGQARSSYVVQLTASGRYDKSVGDHLEDL